MLINATDINFRISRLYFISFMSFVGIVRFVCLLYDAPDGEWRAWWHPGCYHATLCDDAWRLPFRGPFLPCRVQTWFRLKSWSVWNTKEEESVVTSFAIMAQFVLLSPPWIGRVNLGWNCLRNISSDFAKKLHHPFLQSAMSSSKFPPIRIEAGNRERKMPWNWDKGKCGRCKSTLFTRWIVFVRL